MLSCDRVAADNYQGPPHEGLAEEPIPKDISIPAHASDRNLLFGALALQMDFIDRDALIAALHGWVLDKKRSLGEILVAQQILNPDERDALDVLVQKHLDRHRGDAEKSLAAVAVSAPLREELRNLADSDVQASIVHLTTPSEPGAVGPLPVTVDEVKKIAGLRFQILRPHDKGGIGEVFVALDQELNREVALKEIQERHAADKHSRGRFVREAEITGGLEHPGIVRVYGLGQYADGRPFYAMRFIQGETLKDAIARFHRSGEGKARSPEFELRTLLTRFIAVCNAIAYAHSRGVIHRDLKPANIMLGKYGETLIVDWGMAKAGMNEPARSVSEGLPEPYLVPSLAEAIETQAGATMGTPAYMSPEQASGRIDLLGPVTDIYSLGATLYTLLTGRTPIEGKDTAEVLRKAQRGEWLPMRQGKSEAPPALAAICHKAMAASPSARYATALELAAEIEHWLADEPVAAFRESWGARSRRWMRRHRTLVSTAVGVLVIALLSATVGLLFLNDAWDKEALARKDAQDKERESREQKEDAQKQKKEADRRREEARFNQYVAEMTLVQRDYEANNLDRVQELLAAQIPQESGAIDFRNFEWYYWQRMVHRELLILKGHAERVLGMSFSPDVLRLASADRDNTVRVWDAATGKELLILKGHTSSVFGVSFSPDGRQLASASNDKTVRVWDAVTGKELRTLRGHASGVSGVSFSPDGRRLASAGGDRTVRVWDAATGKELLTLKGHMDLLSGVSFSPDGRRLASASHDQTVRVWEALDVPDAVWRKRGLVSEVDALFKQLLLREDVLTTLRKTTTLNEDDRKFALEVAQSLREDPALLYEAAWNTFRLRDAGKDAYARAFRQYEAAIPLASDKGLYINTLGVVQYRLGFYAEALATLSKSEKLIATKEGSIPANLAFLAMTQHKLGNKDEAKATLYRLRIVMKQPRWAKNPESVRLLHNAEELIEGSRRLGGLEGEHLKVLSRSSDYYIGTQAMSGFPDSQWSGDAQLHANPTKVGSWADLELPVPKDGKYEVTVYLTKARDYGIVQFRLAGKELGKPIDCFEPEKVIRTGPLSLGTAELKKGAAILRVKVTGTNQRSLGPGTMWGLDCIVLKPVNP